MKKAPMKQLVIPAPPSWLDESAVTEYHKTAKALDASNVDLRASDFDVVAAYAQAAADVARLTVEIRTEGELVDGYRGSKVKNPKLTVLRQASDRMRAEGNRLGLSPKARLSTPRARVEYR